MYGLVVDTVERTVLDGNIINGVGMLWILIANNHHTIFRFLTSDILHRDVANGGIETTTANLARFIVGVELEHSLTALPDGNVAHVDILNDATAARVGLDAKHAVQGRRVHLAVLSIDILTATADFRTDDHTAVTIVKLTVADDDVLRRCTGKASLTAFTSVVVTSALDGDAVVARVEVAILNQYTVARLGVASVTVRTVVVDVDATNGDVLRQQGVNHPERRTQQGDVFNEDAFALIQVNHLRAKSVGCSETALVHVHAVLGIFQQLGTRSLILGNATRLHAEARIATPGPPCVIRAASVNGAFTRDGDVLGLVGVNQRAEVPAVQSLPTGGDDGV